MQKSIVECKVHVKCDICGKEKTFEETWLKLYDPIDYGWSELQLTSRTFAFTRRTKKYNLCPLCTAKFRKLIGEVEVIEKVSDDEFMVEEKKEMSERK